MSPAGEGLRNYLIQERGLLPETLERFRLGAVIAPDVLDEQAEGMISIPYLTPNGPVAMRFRRPPDRTEGPKYWQPHGSKLTIYNTPALFVTEDTLAISEGELDCITLVQCGIPAVGIPGASAWESHYNLLFEGYSRVLICADNDDTGAGKKFAAKVASEIPDSGPEIVLCEEGHDINSYYQTYGRQALRELMGVAV